MTPRLLVSGGRGGYLGQYVVRAAAGAGHDVVAVGRTDADIRDTASVDGMMERHRPAVVIHTAYVPGDWAVTATGAVNVARAAQRHGARLVLVSSDVVFSGEASPYDESAEPDPITPYGAAKAAAETACLAVCDDVAVARTSVIVGDGDSAHEKRVHALAAGEPGGLFEDERRCPVHVRDLSAALVELAVSSFGGVVHLAGPEAMSRFELGRLVAARDGLRAEALVPTTRAAAGVRGPVDLRLDSSLAGTVLSTPLRSLRDLW